VIPWAGVFDAYTEMDDSRSVGDILLETTADLQEELKKAGNNDITTLIGFENHSGHTYLSEEGKPLGKVIKGKGTMERIGLRAPTIKMLSALFYMALCWPKILTLLICCWPNPYPLRKR